MPQQMSLYFTYSDDNDEDEEVTVSEKDQTYMEEKYHHVTEHIPEIDEMLNRTSEGWKTTRMGKVDLAILASCRLRDEIRRGRSGRCSHQRGR